MERVLTRKGAIVELAIVVAGVLIALSVDTLRQWRNEAAVAAEARANLLSEIQANKTELDGVLKNLPKHADDYRNAHRAAVNLLEDKPLGTSSIQIGFGIAILSASAYTTAENIGAFRYMEYEDARAFSGVYDVQRRYDALQDQAMVNVAAVSAPLLLAGDPSLVRKGDLEVWKRGIEQAIGLLNTQQQIGQGLSAEYAKVLSRRAN